MDLTIPHILIAVTLIALILLQERSAGLSSIFGSEGGGFYQARRGLEKAVFIATIVLTVIFVTLAIYQFISYGEKNLLGAL